MKCQLCIFTMCLLYFHSYAQEVEHNYLVGPNTVTCDSLDIVKEDQKQSIEDIRQAKFRFTQSFKLTRKQGLQAGEFYSCDATHGYLIITYNSVEHLYFEVSQDFWEMLISSSDPEGVYLERQSGLKKNQ